MAAADRAALADITRRWIAVWTTGDLAEFDALHAPDFVDRAAAGRSADRHGFRAGVLAMRAAFPDLVASCDDLVIDEAGSRVAVRWSAHGTHLGDYLGVEATANVIHFRGIEIIAIAGGRVVERWGEWDGLDLLAQLRG